MINANELRIGNWVNSNYEDDKFQLHKVRGFDISLGDDPSGVINMFDPIPLSPEILEAAGFEMDAAPQVPEWHHKSGFWFFDSWGTDSYSIRLMNKIDVHIKHLHQLQNLYYSLTGKELEIKLPLEIPTK